MELTPPKKSNLPIIITVLVAAWIIGMSIIVAGWMITRQLVKNNPAPMPVLPVNIEVPAGIPVQGNNNAKVTLVEFADFQCPYCGEWQKLVYPRLKSEYIDTGKVRFVYMDFPFLGDESIKAAEAARCAMDQGKFWEYHDKLFDSQNGENEGAFIDNNLIQFAKDLQLDVAKFGSCFNARIYKPIIEESIEKGRGYGVSSTPTVFINGIFIEGVGTFENYKQIIEAELGK